MNPPLFSAKRIHLAGQRLWGRIVQHHFGITPARLDMLYAIASRAHGILQWTLRELFDVTAATVSRMLRALEDLGLIERVVLEEDRRYRWVTLTWIGRKIVDDARERFLESGIVQRWVERLLVDERHLSVLPIRRGEAARLDCDRTFGRLREGLLDRARLVIPWHPEVGR